MKKLTFTALCMTLMCAANLLNAITITSFGSASTTAGWTFNSGTGDFSGSSSGGDLLFESFGSAIDITGATGVVLTVTANVAVPSSTAFDFTLQETLGGIDVASFIFTAAELNSGTATAILTNLGGNYSNVGGFLMGASGAPTDSFNVTLGTLSTSPVPEPSAFALIAGCFGLAWVMVRRRA